MSRAKSITRAAYAAAQTRMQIASSVIVLACAAALIMAGQPLPL